MAKYKTSAQTIFLPTGDYGLVLYERKAIKFPGAEKSTPSLVTSSVFARRLRNDPHVNLTIAMKKLTPDQAWFGIRSLIKGSKIADDVRANWIENIPL